MGGFTAQPYAPPTMYSPRNDRIIDLIMHQGDVAARNAAAQGAIWGNAVQQLGGIAADYVGQRQEQKAMERQSMALSEFIDSGVWAKDPRAAIAGSVKILGPERGSKFAEGLLAAAKVQGGVKPEDALKALPGMIRGLEAAPDALKPQLYGAVRNLTLSSGLFTEDSLPAEFSPEIMSVASALAQGLDSGSVKTRQVEVRNPDGSTSIRIVPDVPGQEFTSAPEPAKADARVVGRSLVTPEGKVLYRDPEARSTADEPLVAIMGPDGNPVLVPRSQASGKRPANIREQGRPVVSGDAGRIADFDTSLDDLNTLSGALSGSKATGASAKAGAMLPNWVTEVTGWGTDAKSKQAMIDRVKQVIGKALEGGVLRKEDEVKYEKILPTIGDVPTVVQSKLDGLWNAIEKRRQTLIDSLSDAGYDVSRYETRGTRSRTPADAPAAPKAPEIGAVEDGYRFKGGDPAVPENWEKV